MQHTFSIQIEKQRKIFKAISQNSISCLHKSSYITLKIDRKFHFIGADIITNGGKFQAKKKINAKFETFMSQLAYLV